MKNNFPVISTSFRNSAEYKPEIPVFKIDLRRNRVFLHPPVWRAAVGRGKA